MVRSDRVAKGATRAPHRSLLKALGFINEEIGKPIIGIANSFNEIIPGHVHLKNTICERWHPRSRWYSYGI